MIGALVTLLTLAAVVFFPGFSRWRTSVLDPNGSAAHFDGIQQIYDGPQPRNEARVLLVHGMGAEKDHTYNNLCDALASRLGFETKDAVVDPPRTLAYPTPLPRDSQSAVLYVRTYRNGSRILRTYDVLWAPLIYGIKMNDLADDEEKLAHERAWANGTLKQLLVNTRLTDPVMYLGSSRPYITNAIKQAVCALADGTWSSDANGDCTAPHLDNAGIAVITESLGSFIALEAINELAKPGPGGHILLFPIHGFYMLANQLPLLHLARPDADPMKTFLDNRSFPVRPPNARDLVQMITSMEVVTISDPDDVLSYPISAKLANQYGNAKFVNVRTPIGHRYLAGQFTNPVGAHTGHTDNNRIMNMLARGGGKVRRKTTAVSEQLQDR